MGLGYWCGKGSDLRNFYERLPSYFHEDGKYRWNGKTLDQVPKEELIELVERLAERCRHYCNVKK